ncbi:hypothetical protein C0993_009772, partial [Termitomyces sp. T159_Od127]
MLTKSDKSKDKPDLDVKGVEDGALEAGSGVVGGSKSSDDHEHEVVKMQIKSEHENKDKMEISETVRGK